MIARVIFSFLVFVVVVIGLLKMYQVYREDKRAQLTEKVQNAMKNQEVIEKVSTQVKSAKTKSVSKDKDVIDKFVDNNTL